MRDDEFLTVAEVAELLKLNQQTVRNDRISEEPVRERSGHWRRGAVGCGRVAAHSGPPGHDGAWT